MRSESLLASSLVVVLNFLLDRALNLLAHGAHVWHLDVRHDLGREFRQVDTRDIERCELRCCETGAIRVLGTAPTLANLPSALFIDDPGQAAVVAAVGLGVLNADAGENKLQFLRAISANLMAEVLAAPHRQDLLVLFAGQQFLQDHQADLDGQGRRIKASEDEALTGQELK